MESLFTWAHLSDLHVHAPREDIPSPGARMLAALRHDLAAQARERVDALLVSGDVAWSGQREEYVAADTFLVQTARALGLGPERVFVVAGDHDVDRAGRAALTSKLVAELRQGRRALDAALEHPRAREVLTARLYAFSVFSATFGPAPAEDAPPEPTLWWSHRVEGRGGLRVRLVGLCSAFLAEGDADRGALRVGEQQLHDAARTIAPGELVIALSHHPARGGWLADEHDVDGWLREHAHVHVTGHAHDPISDEARAGAPGPFAWIAAGAFGAERRLGYALVSVVRRDDGSLGLHVTPRRWSPEEGRFVGDGGRESTLNLTRAGLGRDVVDRRRFASDLLDAGLTLRRRGDVAEAIDCLKRALAIRERLGEMDGRAEILGGLGLCYRDVGELASATDHFRRALAIHEELGHRAGEATVLGNLGNTYRLQGDLGRAVEHLERALAIYEELGLPDGQGAALSNLGLCYRALALLPQARERYERALALFRRTGLPDDHPHVRMVRSALDQLAGATRPRA